MRLASIALALCAIAGCGETHSSADAARPTPPTPIDVTGTWRTCALTLTLGDDGSLAFLDEARGCTARGDYTLDARTLELRWDAASECETLAGATQIREAVLGAGGMVLVDPSSGSTQRFAAEGTPVETWSAEGIESGTPELTRRSVLRVIGALGEGFGQGCYWSADDECGGLFSCGGSIVEWRREERSPPRARGCRSGSTA